MLNRLLLGKLLLLRLGILNHRFQLAHKEHYSHRYRNATVLPRSHLHLHAFLETFLHQLVLHRSQPRGKTRLFSPAFVSPLQTAEDQGPCAICGPFRLVVVSGVLPSLAHLELVLRITALQVTQTL